MGPMSKQFSTFSPLEEQTIVIIREEKKAWVLCYEYKAELENEVTDSQYIYVTYVRVKYIKHNMIKYNKSSMYKEIHFTK